MRWEYRTILFEFAKDGLLGDKYIDDVEVENTLNEQGQEQWEVISVTMLRDGLLAILKRACSQRREPAAAVRHDPRPADDPKQLREPYPPPIEEREPTAPLKEPVLRCDQDDDDDLIGDIRIR
jgi:hypothetical protein